MIAVVAKYGRRRWVQATTVGLLLVIVGWLALRAESTAAEERILSEFAQVMAGLNQIAKKEPDTGGQSTTFEPDTPTVDQLREQASRAIEHYQQEFSEPDPGKPIQMELH